MAAEQPAVAAVIARLPEYKIQLAAYGIVFPLALVVEAPVIMLLSASTELSRDKLAYRELRAFTHRMALVLTVLHLLLAVTPLYHVLTSDVLAVPPEVADVARPALIVMLPWTWMIASRRTDQGALIRYGHSKVVGQGTALRLVATALALAAGYLHHSLSGVVVGTCGLVVGVVVEALYVAWRVRKVVRDEMPPSSPEPPLRGRSFRAFYVPLALTPVVALMVQPIGAAALGRMPDVLDSLAVWPVVSGLLFVFQAPGLALNEVVVAALGRAGAAGYADASRALKRFCGIASLLLTLALLLLVATPLRDPWFRDVAGLSPELAHFAALAILIGAPVPATRVIQGWQQGRFVVQRRTRPITEAVVVSALTSIAVFAVGILSGRWPGLYVAMWGLMFGRVTQTIWLQVRMRSLPTS